MTLKLHQLSHFLALAEHGNFHRAANASNITQQALSASIGKLEESLNAVLFERGPNGVILTPSGERLVHRAKLICSEAHRAELEIQEIENARTGTVRIGVGAFFAERLVPVFLANYLRDHPDLNITLVEGPSTALFAALSHGELDFSLSTPPPSVELPPDLEHELLFTMPTAVHMHVHHPLAHTDPLLLADLVETSWVTAPTFANTLTVAFLGAGLQMPRRVMWTDTFPAIRFLVAERQYVMLGADPPVELSLFTPGTVVTRQVTELQDSMQAVLVWRKSSPLLPAANRLMLHVRNIYRSLVAPS